MPDGSAIGLEPEGRELGEHQIRKVAFIGVGRMGGRMAARLAAGEFEVVVHDPSPAAVASLESAGATAAPDPATAARGADAILCSLPNPAALDKVMSGSPGVLETVEPGTIIVDFSTGDPETARSVAAAAGERGARFLDAPVSRGVKGAETGTLAMLVGGEAETLADARPLLSVLASDIVHVGDVGAGQVTKLCNNMLAAINATALGEVLVAGVRAGVELGPLAEAIGASSGGSFVLEQYLPAGLFTAERPVGFALALMRKDLGLFMDAGSKLSVELPVSAAVQQRYVAAAANGLDDADWTSVAELYERSAGQTLNLDGGVAALGEAS